MNKSESALLERLAVEFPELRIQPGARLVARRVSASAAAEGQWRWVIDHPDANINALMPEIGGTDTVTQTLRSKIITLNKLRWGTAFEIWADV